MPSIGHQMGFMWLWWLIQLPAILAGLALLSYGILVLVLYLVSGSALRRAEKALKEERLADALRLFRKVARMEFGKISAGGTGSPRFEDAMLGIVTTYSRVGKTVDLRPLRNLHAKVKALHSDRNYRGAPGEEHAGHLSEAGLKILGEIVCEAHGVLDRLPSLGG